MELGMDMGLGRRNAARAQSPRGRQRFLPTRPWLLLALAVMLLGGGGLIGAHAVRRTAATCAGNAASAPAQPVAVPAGSKKDAVVHHYEYVFPDGCMYVYDIDNGHRLLQRVPLPTHGGVRGVVTSPRTHMLYVSCGGDGGRNGTGSLIAINLFTNQLEWIHHYSHGIDSMDISPDGKTIFMPEGELSGNETWYVINAQTGDEQGSVGAGVGPHNTVVSLDGRYVFMGPRNGRYLVVADAHTHQVIRRIGPLYSGVRPFTINGTDTLAFTTATGFLGFQVSDIRTGHVLYTVPVRGFSWHGHGPSAPSHGISLSPNERELYLIDSPNSTVHVFDVSDLPASQPRQVADIAVPSMAGDEQNCAYDCLRDGWLQHSLDGRFVYVGDSGGVISTATRRVVAVLPALANTRKMLEVDWKDGYVVATSSRTGVGHVTGA